MTYHGYSNKSFGTHCLCGAKKSSVFFQLCWSCQREKNIKVKRLAKLQKKSAKALARNEKALKKATKLPAKNRKKSKIIDALMAGLPLQKPEPKKPKTMRYPSLETALRLKKLEPFD